MKGLVTRIASLFAGGRPAPSSYREDVAEDVREGRLRYTPPAFRVDGRSLDFEFADIDDEELGNSPPFFFAYQLAIFRKEFVDPGHAGFLAPYLARVEAMVADEVEKGRAEVAEAGTTDRLPRLNYAFFSKARAVLEEAEREYKRRHDLEDRPAPGTLTIKVPNEPSGPVQVTFRSDGRWTSAALVPLTKYRMFTAYGLRPPFTSHAPGSSAPIPPGAYLYRLTDASGTVGDDRYVLIERDGEVAL
jgi:hypothetical protein